MTYVTDTLSLNELINTFKTGDIITVRFDHRRCIGIFKGLTPNENETEPLEPNDTCAYKIAVYAGINAVDIVMVNDNFGLDGNTIEKATEAEINYLFKCLDEYREAHPLVFPKFINDMIDKSKLDDKRLKIVDTSKDDDSTSFIFGNGTRVLYSPDNCVPFIILPNEELSIEDKKTILKEVYNEVM